MVSAEQYNEHAYLVGQSCSLWGSVQWQDALHPRRVCSPSAPWYPISKSPYSYHINNKNKYLYKNRKYIFVYRATQFRLLSWALNKHSNMC